MNEEYLKKIEQQISDVRAKYKLTVEECDSPEYVTIANELQAILNENNVNISLVSSTSEYIYVHYDYQFKSPLANGQYKWGKAVYGPEASHRRGLVTSLLGVARAVNQQRQRIEDPRDKGRYRQF